MRITRSTHALRIFRDSHRCTYLLPFYVPPLGRVRRVPRRMRTYKEQGPRHSLIQSHATTNGCARRFVRSFNRLDKRTNERMNDDESLNQISAFISTEPRQATTNNFIKANMRTRTPNHYRPAGEAVLAPPFLLCHFLGSLNIGRLVPLTGGEVYRRTVASYFTHGFWQSS